MNEFNLSPEDMPVIGIDFDGTIVEDNFPEIGPAIPGAIETIKEWYDAGYWIIIHSCRSGMLEDNMNAWLGANRVKRHATNDNIDHLIQKYGSNPRKLGVDINIDDKNIYAAGHAIIENDWNRFKHLVYLFTKKRELS